MSESADMQAVWTVKWNEKAITIQMALTSTLKVTSPTITLSQHNHYIPIVF